MKFKGLLFKRYNEPAQNREKSTNGDYCLGSNEMWHGFI